jgi:hypothetical protein
VGFVELAFFDSKGGFVSVVAILGLDDGELLLLLSRNRLFNLRGHVMGLEGKLLCGRLGIVGFRGVFRH